MKLNCALPLFACVALVGGLSGCSQEKAPSPPSEHSTLSGPDTKAGLAASEGRLILPVISGRPAAVYFSVRNDGAEPVTLAGVDVQGADHAEMHQTEGGTMSAVESLPITPGASVVFAPGGLHVMAFKLPETIKSGDVVEMTLTFSDGDKLSMPLRVETMGASAEDNEPHKMEGMHH